MGKKPITSAQVRTLRNNVKEKPLQELLLNLGVDLMLRSSDLLNLKVSDVVSDSGKVKTEVKVKQKKTGKSTLNIPLSKNSINSIKKHLVRRDLDSWIFVGNKSHYTKSPITQKQYSRIVKGWMSSLGVEDLNNYSLERLKVLKYSNKHKMWRYVVDYLDIQTLLQLVHTWELRTLMHLRLRETSTYKVLCSVSFPL